MTPQPPSRIETPRLVLRAWTPDDAPLLKDAIDTSLDHLRPWMPWALTEPSPLAAIRDRLSRFAEAFVEGRDWLYGIFPPDEASVIGGAGLHPRIGSGGLEIGYWVRAGCTGRGYATEAARALTRAGFAVHGIDRIEIHCDPRNVRSTAVPRRLGFAHVETIPATASTPAATPRSTMVWRLVRADFSG